MKCTKVVAAAGMLVGICFCSRATILLPGQDGLDAPQAPASTAPLFTLTTPYSFGGLSGTITSWVVRDPANPLGGLSFYYQVTDTGTEAIGRVSTSDFGIIPGTPVEVSTITASFGSGLPNGIMPNIASRSVGPGSVVGFNFLGAPLDPGRNSVILVVNTSFQEFNVTAGAIINSSAVNVDILGPSLVPIPEPSTVIAGSLLLIPFGASALRIVRKRQAQIANNLGKKGP